MPVLSLPARRLAACKSSTQRTAVPCARCLDAYARSNVSCPCIFPSPSALWDCYAVKDKQYYRCKKC